MARMACARALINTLYTSYTINYASHGCRVASYGTRAHRHTLVGRRAVLYISCMSTCRTHPCATLDAGVHDQAIVRLFPRLQYFSSVYFIFAQKCALT